MEQLTFEDIVGNMDYTAHSTAAKFLSNHSVTPTYAVEFFDRDKKQRRTNIDEKRNRHENKRHLHCGGWENQL